MNNIEWQFAAILILIITMFWAVISYREYVKTKKEKEKRAKQYALDLLTLEMLKNELMEKQKGQ